MGLGDPCVAVNRIGTENGPRFIGRVRIALPTSLASFSAGATHDMQPALDEARAT